MEPHSCECFEDGPPQFEKARLLGKLLTEWVASHALTGPEPEKEAAAGLLQQRLKSREEADKPGLPADPACAHM